MMTWLAVNWLMMTPVSASGPQRYRLGAGDIIHLEVDAHKALNRAFSLSARGDIDIPYIGKLRVVGLTRQQAEQKLRRHLASYFRDLQKVSIRSVQQRKYVWIKGWVRQPGRYLLQKKDSIEALLRHARGVKPGARLDKIWFHTPGDAPRKLNLLQYYQDGKHHKAPKMTRGTVVFVPVSRHQSPEIGLKGAYTTASNISVLGAVKRPGAFPCFWQMNLLQTLAMAGGPLSKSGIQEILITPPGGRTYWFDLKRYYRKDGGPSLPKLMPGTVVMVPFRAMGRSQRGPVRIIGEVHRPGVWRGSSEKNVTGWLARSGGPTSHADLGSVAVVHRGSNFTIHQVVDVKRALKEGHLKRLPPTSQGKIVIYVPKKETKSRAVQDTQTALQIAIAVTSVATSVVLLAVTLSR